MVAERKEIMKPRADGSFRTEPSLNPKEPPDMVECQCCEGEKVVTIEDMGGSYGVVCWVCKGEGEILAHKERDF